MQRWLYPVPSAQEATEEDLDCKTNQEGLSQRRENKWSPVLSNEAVMLNILSTNEIWLKNSEEFDL